MYVYDQVLHSIFVNKNYQVQFDITTAYNQ